MPEPPKSEESVNPPQGEPAQGREAALWATMQSFFNLIVPIYTGGASAQDTPVQEAPEEDNPVQEAIFKYLEEHPGSTSERVARDLNLPNIGGYLCSQCDRGNLIRFSDNDYSDFRYYILPVSIRRQIEGMPTLPDEGPKRNIWRRLAEGD